MYRPLALYIGLRYIRAKRTQHFISFISLTSMLGIALGVAVLITVLSVMNGFDDEIHQHFFGLTPEITITNFTGKMLNWEKWSKEIKKTSDVKADIKGVAPYIGGEGLLTYNNQTLPAAILGIDPDQETTISELSSKMIAGRFESLKKHRFGIILGRSQAMSLGVWLGDKVTVMIPQVNMTLAGAIPRFKRFDVVGIFSVGPGFGFDRELSFIELKDAQKLFQMGNSVTGLRLKIVEPYSAPVIGMKIAQHLPPTFQVNDWTDSFGAYFKAVKMEKTMMFLILTLIIGVAAFNLVSSLVMLVNDKQSEIAILRTIGALPSTVMQIFMVQGSLIGLLGVGLGLFGGLLLSYNATAIVNWLQNVLHVQWLSSNVYFVDFLPSRLEWADVTKVCGIAFLLSFIATLYPAWQASRIQPAEALRYE